MSALTTYSEPGQVTLWASVAVQPAPASIVAPGSETETSTPARVMVMALTSPAAAVYTSEWVVIGPGSAGHLPVQVSGITPVTTSTFDADAGAAHTNSAA